MTSASSPVSSIPLKAFLHRAIPDFEEFTGLSFDLPPREVRPGQAWSLVLSVLGRRLTQPNGFNAFLTAFPRLVEAFARPSDAPNQNGLYASTLYSAENVAKTLETEGAVILHVTLPRAEWEGFYRSRVSVMLDAAGLAVAREVWLRPGRGEVWLRASGELNEVQWPPSGGEPLAALFASLVRFHGGPLLEVRWSKNTNGKDQMECVLAPPREPAADEKEMVEFIEALAKAQKEMPRGYVGLKLFRDRLFRPTDPLQQRRGRIEAALRSEIVLRHSVVDSSTGTVTATLELNKKHPLVAQRM